MLIDRSTKPDTRQKILAAAYSVLSSDGYENTSIKDIAEAAGVAQGLVHYYFKSKQHLVLDVLVEVCHKLEIGGAEGTEGAQEAYEKFKAMLKSDTTTHALYIQLLAVGMHDKEIGAGVVQFLREDRAHIEQIADQVLAQRGQNPGAAKAIASVIEAAVLGIMIQNLVDPEFDAGAAVDALNEMSLSAVFTAAQNS
ncbi:MAG TPA: TetR/AcrR family transcriptional regulator [Candidatus Dormibacteraeota bacterium]|jgi:AcrR family transcriptional regulator|nr:TetR/AcrR family transcriptional regulator [Candidatus Dormibacteraeota bacterium]HEX2681681.1 TetR/AcrR family transcriptional regulator [Candidatus Dormibacteraeota bacterium]